MNHFKTNALALVQAYSYKYAQLGLMTLAFPSRATYELAESRRKYVRRLLGLERSSRQKISLDEVIMMSSILEVPPGHLAFMDPLEFKVRYIDILEQAS